MLSVIVKAVICYGKIKSEEHEEMDDEETNDPEKPRLFVWLIDFACALNPTFKNHMDTIFKDISITMLSDVFQSLLCIYRDEVSQEIQEAACVAVIIEEVYVSYKYAMVFIWRYELNGDIHERIWGFFIPENQTGDSISKQILKVLDKVLEEDTQKLIALTFDGANFMKGIKAQVHDKVLAVYGNAHFVDCYTNGVLSILKHAADNTIDSEVYFNVASGISSFFSESPYNLSFLEKHLKMDPTTQQTAVESWNVSNGLIERVYENLQPLKDCFREIEAASYTYEAEEYLMWLSDDKFHFWLECFYRIVPHLEMLCHRMNSQDIDVANVKGCIAEFITIVSQFRDSQYHENSPETHMHQAKEMCDLLIMDISYRYSSVKHLMASKLLEKNQFQRFKREPPSKEFEKTAELYPIIDGEKLSTELKAFYCRPELHDYGTLTKLLRFLISDDDLFQGFSEITKLIKILVTIPMATQETDRCFPTLNNLKSFLKNTTTIHYEGLEAIAVVGLGDLLLNSDIDIIDKVIDHYSECKERGVEFIYK